MRDLDTTGWASWADLGRTLWIAPRIIWLRRDFDYSTRDVSRVVPDARTSSTVATRHVAALFLARLQRAIRLHKLSPHGDMP